MVRSLVGERGQMTIGKSLRERLGIRPGDVAVQVVESGRLVVYFIPAPHRRSLRGVLRPRPGRPITDWDAVRESMALEIARDAVSQAARMTRGSREAGDS